MRLASCNHFLLPSHHTLKGRFHWKKPVMYIQPPYQYPLIQNIKWLRRETDLLNLVFNTKKVFYPSIGLVLLLYYIGEFSTSMVLVLYCIQKASIAHHCCEVAILSIRQKVLHRYCIDTWEFEWFLFNVKQKQESTSSRSKGYI